MLTLTVVGCGAVQPNTTSQKALQNQNAPVSEIPKLEESIAQPAPDINEQLDGSLPEVEQPGVRMNL